MIPKEKAIELVNSCNDLSKDFTRGVSMNEFSKQFALLMVSEIIKQEAERCLAYKETDKFVDYWQEVKQEIEKL